MATVIAPPPRRCLSACPPGLRSPVRRWRSRCAARPHIRVTGTGNDDQDGPGGHGQEAETGQADCGAAHSPYQGNRRRSRAVHRARAYHLPAQEHHPSHSHDQRAGRTTTRTAHVTIQAPRVVVSVSPRFVRSGHGPTVIIHTAGRARRGPDASAQTHTTVTGRGKQRQKVTHAAQVAGTAHVTLTP